jgi:hypothetical protein
MRDEPEPAILYNVATTVPLGASTATTTTATSVVDRTVAPTGASAFAAAATFEPMSRNVSFGGLSAIDPFDELIVGRRTSSDGSLGEKITALLRSRHSTPQKASVGEIGTSSAATTSAGLISPQRLPTSSTHHAINDVRASSSTTAVAVAASGAVHVNNNNRATVDISSNSSSEDDDDLLAIKSGLRRRQESVDTTTQASQYTAAAATYRIDRTKALPAWLLDEFHGYDSTHARAYIFTYIFLLRMIIERCGSRVRCTTRFVRLASICGRRESRTSSDESCCSG